MMVWMGVYSQSFLAAVRKTTARILDQTLVNVPVRVQAPAVRAIQARWRRVPVSLHSRRHRISAVPAGDHPDRDRAPCSWCSIVILRKRSRAIYGHLSLVALVAAMAGAVCAYTSPGPAFSGMLIVDGFATFFRVLVIGVGILTVLASYRFLEREDAETGEYHALLLFSIAGQCVMVAANELIMIFIGLEISSIASYVLAGYLRDDKRNNEAALKYFLLGSFATAFFLYGVAVIYGMTGTTYLAAIRASLTAGNMAPAPVFIGVAVALMFVGLGFKVSGAPFQVWAPDVYQGAPTPVSAFLATGPKAAAFAIFLRIFMTAFQPIARDWEPLVWVSALLSMTIGNFAALTQSNVKRLLAYSSIAHAGYVLVALAARSQVGTAAAMFYLAAYAFMNIGAFAVVSHLSGKGERFLSCGRFRGPGSQTTGHRRAACDFPAVAYRRAAHRRILRQVLHLQGRAGVAPGVAHRAGTAEQRGGGVLLSAPVSGDVYARAFPGQFGSRAAACRVARGAGDFRAGNAVFRYLSRLGVELRG